MIAVDSNEKTLKFEHKIYLITVKTKTFIISVVSGRCWAGAQDSQFVHSTLSKIHCATQQRFQNIEAYSWKLVSNMKTTDKLLLQFGGLLLQKYSDKSKKRHILFLFVETLT